MRTSILRLAALAFAAPAFAQNTQIVFEGSQDAGQTWHGGTMPYTPGNTLLIRARIDLVHAGTNTVLGFVGINFQPKLTNFFPAQGDRVLPFSSLDGTGVAEFPESNLGRLLPFASSGMSSGSSSGLLTSHVDADNALRFAGANATSATTNLAWGVSCGQTPRSLAGTDFRETTQPFVFRYGVVLNNPTATECVATVDLATVLQQRGAWYRTNAGTNSLLAPVTQDTIVPLHIVVPAPSAAFAMIACGLVAHRRRPT